jgi:hypothetical protein
MFNLCHFSRRVVVHFPTKAIVVSVLTVQEDTPLLLCSVFTYVEGRLLPVIECVVLKRYWCLIK